MLDVPARTYACRAFVDFTPRTRNTAVTRLDTALMHVIGLSIKHLPSARFTHRKLSRTTLAGLLSTVSKTSARPLPASSIGRSTLT